MADGATQGTTGMLSVDINERLLNGAPNPYFLRPFIFQAEPRLRRHAPARTTPTVCRPPTSSISAGTRAGASGWARTISSATANTRTKNQNVYTYREDIISGPDGRFPTPPATAMAVRPCASFSAFTSATTRGRTSNTPRPGGVMGITPTTMATPSPAFFRTIRSRFGVGADQPQRITRHPEDEGRVFRAILLKGRIVTTLGKREDQHFTKLNNATATAAGLEPRFRLQLRLSSISFRRFPCSSATGSAIQKGVVVKPFRGWDFIEKPAAQATGVTRFLAQTLRGLERALQRVRQLPARGPGAECFSSSLPDPSGEGKDYGFSLNLFDGKLYLKVNKYETMTLNSRGGPSTSHRGGRPGTRLLRQRRRRVLRPAGAGDRVAHGGQSPESRQRNSRLN
jgi:hypothetical protein